MTATNKIAKSAVRELARRLTMPAVTA
jgi:hypothetical protein